MNLADNQLEQIQTALECYIDGWREEIKKLNINKIYNEPEHYRFSREF